MSKGNTPRKLVRDRPLQSAPTDQEQFKRFVEAAQELGTDLDPDRFDETLRAVAKHKPKQDKQFESKSAEEVPKPQP